VDAAVDYGAHGRFDRRAERWSPALELAIHRRVAFTAAALVGSVAAFAAARIVPRLAASSR
jgi:hypothetical protein